MKREEKMNKGQRKTVEIHKFMWLQGLIVARRQLTRLLTFSSWVGPNADDDESSR